MAAISVPWNFPISHSQVWVDSIEGENAPAEAFLAGSIKDTSSWQENRTLPNLPAFIESFTEKPENLSRPPRKKGSPHTLIVAAAGLRAADIAR